MPVCEIHDRISICGIKAEDARRLVPGLRVPDRVSASVHGEHGMAQCGGVKMPAVLWSLRRQLQSTDAGFCHDFERADMFVIRFVIEQGSYSLGIDHGEFDFSACRKSEGDGDGWDHAAAVFLAMVRMPSVLSSTGKFDLFSHHPILFAHA